MEWNTLRRHSLNPASHGANVEAAAAAESDGGGGDVESPYVNSMLPISTSTFTHCVVVMRRSCKQVVSRFLIIGEATIRELQEPAAMELRRRL
jgi:hypothetical protein